MYVGSADAHAYALNASTGAQVWSTSVGGPVTTTPAVAYGRVYVTSNTNTATNKPLDAELWMLNARSGTPDGPDTNDPTALGCNNGVGGNATATSPAVENGLVYAACSSSDTSMVRGFGAFDFSSLVSSAQPDSPPVVANGVLYLGDAGGASEPAGDLHFHAIAATPDAKGALDSLWSAPMGPVTAAPAVANGNVYVGSTDGNVYAFNLSGGVDLPQARPAGGGRPAPGALTPDRRLRPRASQPAGHLPPTAPGG